MNSFLKSVRSGSSNKDGLVRKSIITQLSESVKEIQVCGLEDSISGDSVDITDASNNLCSIIEAMFLHGLKDSLMHKARRVIGNDVDQRPEPSFLSPLYIYSHRQIIEQISSLSHITSDIGQCRAWIRIALNDSLLSSYISLMAKDPKPLMPFYKANAFVRDADTLDVARKLIESVEMCNSFQLPCNSSLLNHWPLPTLLLAGIWSPPLRQCPISSGIDVAQSLEETSYLKSMSGASSHSNLSLASSQASEFSRMLALNEDDAFKIILANTKQNLPASDARQDKMEMKQEEDNNARAQSMQDDHASSASAERTVEENATNFSGNSLNRHSGWSFDGNHTDINSPPDTIRQTSIDNALSVSGIDGAKSNEHSYHALIQSYNLVSGPESAPNLDEVLNKLNIGSGSGNDDNWSPNSLHEDMNTFEFTNVNSMSIEKVKLSKLLAQVGKLPQEKGLDQQNYECCGCKHPLGINLCKPRVCAFTGECFCDGCMSAEPMVIPARIIHNWDFKQYYVSKESAVFINEIKNHPVLDLKVLNSCIYKGVEEMQRLRNVRVQLNYLRDYLFTCREPIIEQFKKFIWPRDYMYEHIHQYSIADLTQISGGQLAQELQKLVKFGREHVVNCWLCSQKGFFCELCQTSKILYPFDVNSTFRCDSCSAVFHLTCLDFTKPCPKCKRKRERLEKQELSLFEATLLK